MRRIDKGAEPAALAAHRGTPGASYEGLFKKPIQESLCRVQHHLCCFCQSRIEANGKRMRIAHFAPQAGASDMALVWSNMWGACCGGEAEPGEGPAAERYHCDKLQGDSAIHPRLNPAFYEHGTLRYRNDGTIYADAPEVDCAVNQVLGLNRRKLQQNRWHAKEAMKRRLERWSTTELLKVRSQLEDPTLPRWNEYLDYLLWYLDRKLKSR